MIFMLAVVRETFGIIMVTFGNKLIFQVINLFEQYVVVAMVMFILLLVQQLFIKVVITNGN